jgi:hypothetical protein
LIFGIIWLSRIIKYVKAIYRDGGFSDALDRIEASDPSSDCKTRIRARGMRLSLNLLTVMSVLSIDLSFAQTYEVNLVPHFLLGAVMIFVYARLIKLSGVTKRHLLFPVLYTAASAVTFYFQTDFLLKYGYEDLLRNEAAREAYPTVELFAAIEFALLIAAFASLYVILKRFILDNTGVSPTSDKYGRIDKDYHTSLLTKTALLSVFGILSGAAQLASVIANGAIKVVYTDPDDVTMPVIIAPSIAWIGLLVTAMAIAYIGYTVYYVSTMKDELSLNSSRY